jgi:hypothetical protein
MSLKNPTWGEIEKQQWLAEQSIKRSYTEEVVTVINSLAESFDVEQYGALSYDSEKYPLLIVKSKNWDIQKPTILVTGGVHGYETSGVHGALKFLSDSAANYSHRFNIAVAPCVSPWGYETINRWNPYAVDPNRSFIKDSPAEESKFLMQAVASLEGEVFAHFDLHETTDTDNTVFRPALAARDGIVQNVWNIPDGFYVVGNSDEPVADFQTAVIQSVEKVTHIAPPDDEGKIIGKLLEQKGVINYPIKSLGLCAGMTDAKYATTTEVYPDSPKVTDEECNLAQVTAIVGGLDYLLAL